jgi:hypothetical protein
VVSACESTWCHNREHRHWHLNLPENLKSRIHSRLFIQLSFRRHAQLQKIKEGMKQKWAEVEGCLFMSALCILRRKLLPSSSYLTCQNEFRGTFPDYPVPNWSTVSHLVNYSTGCINHEEKCECMPWIFPILNVTLVLFSDFSVIDFVTNRTCVRNGLHVLSGSLYKTKHLDQN